MCLSSDYVAVGIFSCAWIILTMQNSVQCRTCGICHPPPRGRRCQRVQPAAAPGPVQATAQGTAAIHGEPSPREITQLMDRLDALEQSTPVSASPPASSQRRGSSRSMTVGVLPAAIVGPDHATDVPRSPEGDVTTSSRASMQSAVQKSRLESLGLIMGCTGELHSSGLPLTI